MKVSLIISFYKNPPFLNLILKSLAVQSEKNFEVIIAEDDNAEETIYFLKEQRKTYSFRIEHCSQENSGFRKNKILNEAVRRASAPYLVLIDGDCVLHSKFIETHLKYSKPKQTLIGRRLMLSKRITEKAIEKNDIFIFKFVNFLKYSCSKIECGIYLPFLNSNRKEGIWGCNWSVFKEDLIAVNGFDEDYVRAGVGEDVDIEWRLRENGSSFRSVKFKSVQYHLYHKPNYSDEDVNFNFEVLKSKKELGNIVCKNGLVKHQNA